MSYLLILCTTVFVVVILLSTTFTTAVRDRERGRLQRTQENNRSKLEREDANRRFLMGMMPRSPGEPELPQSGKPKSKLGGTGLSL